MSFICLINYDWGVLLGENNFYIKIILYYIFLCLYYIFKYKWIYNLFFCIL